MTRLIFHRLPEIETHSNDRRITVDSYIGVIKDVMALRKNLCILRHFHKLKRPSASSSAMFIGWFEHLS